MHALTVAALQMACGPSRADNLDRMEQLIRRSANEGAQLIVPQELFADQYFCKDESLDHFDLAEEYPSSTVVQRFSSLARELNVVLPSSFFERAGNCFFNSLTVADSDGTLCGLYRKSHIPDGPGYEEKYYFSPGDTGFQVFATSAGALGVGICWNNFGGAVVDQLSDGRVESICWQSL